MIAAALLACAVNVAPVTLEAIIQVESGGDPLALNVNHLSGPQLRVGTQAEAVTLAQSYIARGYSVDLGLMQVNSRNLAALGVSLAEILDPCTNIRSGAAILTADYAAAARTHGEGQGALQAALSAYNTGSFDRGFANGYVAKYYGRHAVPALAGGVRQATETAALIRRAVAPPAAVSNPYTADTQIYVRKASNVLIE